MYRGKFKKVKQEIDRVIFDSMSEFLVGDGLPIRDEENDGRGPYIQYRRRRDDALWEALSFSLDASEDGIPDIYAQLAINFFDDAPIPAGVFGFDLDMQTVVLEANSYSDIEAPYTYPFSMKGPSEQSDLLITHLKQYGRITLDKWDEQLLADPILSEAYTRYSSISMSDLDAERERLRAEMDQLFPEQQTVTKFPARKTAHQMVCRKKGVGHWSRL